MTCIIKNRLHTSTQAEKKKTKVRNYLFATTFFLGVDKKNNYFCPPTFLWGISSVGRALAWHARGQRFEPAILHFIQMSKLP